MFLDQGKELNIIMVDTTHYVALSTRYRDALKKISQLVEKGRQNQSIRRLLRSTLKGLTTVVKDIKQYNENMDHPSKEINTLIEENVAQDSAFKNSWLNNCFSWLRNDSYVVDDNQSLTVYDVKETLYKTREILELLNKENFEQKFNEAGPPIFKGAFGVTENPEFIVGMDVQFSKLKMELLRDGSSTLVLTGLGGLGKTTLATNLCWDEQIKGRW